MTFKHICDVCRTDNIVWAKTGNSFKCMNKVCINYDSWTVVGFK